MFTGLIDDVGELLELRDGGAGKTLRIATQYDLASLKTGASIACAGICLTVIEQGEEKDWRWFTVQVSTETLAKTTLGKWKKGQRIDLERALKLGDPFGGHLVTGHIDGVARILTRKEEGECVRFTLRAPEQLAQFIAQKGSVTLDGVSLTVNYVNGAEFGITLIPHSLKMTSFGAKQAGDEVNLEVDLIARYLARLNELKFTPAHSRASGNPDINLTGTPACAGVSGKR